MPILNGVKQTACADITAGVIESIPEYTGTPRYVATTGDDSDGLTWDTAYNTILQAVADCSPLDVVFVKGNTTYNENTAATGLLLDVDAILIECVDGAKAVIINTDTTNGGAAVTITGNSVTLRNFRVTKGETTSTGSYGVNFDGTTSARLDECTVLVPNAATHTGVIFSNGATACGLISRDPVHSAVFGLGGVGIGVDFDSATRCFLSKSGVGVATTGVVFGTSALLCSVGKNCVVQDCGTGVLFESGATSNILDVVPLRTTTADIVDLSGNATNAIADSLAKHEDASPWSTGQGDAALPVTVSNLTTDGAGGTTSDQDFWGDVTILIAPNVLTVAWLSVGVEFYAVNFNQTMQVETFFTQPSIASNQNGGNDWDKNETVLTVDDGSLFQDNDVIWITGTDRAAGEVMLVNGAPAANVVTVARETTFDAQAGLRYDYDIAPGANKMYLLRRPGLAQYDAFRIGFSAASARAFLARYWHASKQLAPNTAFLARVLNQDNDDDSAVDIRALYED